MLVLMPIGSKPTSPASVPSSTDGFFRNGMAAERSTIAMLCERIAGRVAGAPLNAADASSESETCICQIGLRDLPLRACIASRVRERGAHARSRSCTDRGARR